MSGHERSVNKYCTAVYKVQNLVRNNPFNWSESPPFSLVRNPNPPFSLVRIPLFHWSKLGIHPFHWSESPLFIGQTPPFHWSESSLLIGQSSLDTGQSWSSAWISYWKPWWMFSTDFRKSRYFFKKNSYYYYYYYSYYDALFMKYA